MPVDHCEFEKERYKSVQVWKRLFLVFLHSFCFSGETLEGRMCVDTLLIKARSILGYSDGGELQY